jgi:hypothetical protein
MTVDLPTDAVLEKTTVPLGKSLAEECSSPSPLIVWAVAWISGTSRLVLS